MTDPIVQLEAARRAEQHRLDHLRGPGERNRLGQFATPNALAVAIAGHLLRLRGDRPGPVRFLDPSVGSGSFYSAFRQVFPADRVGRSAGIELDPAFADAAASIWGAEGLEVTAGDFTRLEPPPSDRLADLILANPPYVRHHHLGLEEKARLRALVGERVGIPISGLAGLYAHFVLLADAWLADGGLAAWLIPSEFMDVNYGEAIRGYLTGRVRLRQIHRFDPLDAQFGDALVTSALVVFEKAPPDPGSTALMSFGGPLHDPERAEMVPVADLRAARKWTQHPRPASLAEDFATSTTHLGDLFTIRRGLVTGSNEFFILPRDEAEARGLPDRFLRPILPGPRHLADPVIEAGDDGHPAVDRPLVLLDCDRPEGEVRRDHPELWAYLEEGVARGLDQGYLTSRRAPWYSQERREPPPFVCTYMGRPRGDRPPFRIFWNRSRAVAANVYLLLYPKGPLRRALEANPALAAAVFGLLRDIRPAHFLDEGRVYGGGLRKMEPKELAALPADAILAAIPRQAILAGA